MITKTRYQDLEYRPISSLNRPKMKKINKTIPKHMHNIVERYGWVKVRLNGQDLIIAICGGRGTGKTNTAGYLGEIWDSTPGGMSRFPLFRKGGETEMDNRIPSVCYGTNQLNEFWKWQSYLFQKYGPKATMGRVCIVEEAQNLFNSREYYSRKNMNILKNFLTGRSFGNIYILTYPSFERIDGQIKELVDLRIDMAKPDFDRGLFCWKAKKLYTMHNGKIGSQYFRERIGKKSFVRDGFYYSPPASKELYESLKWKGDQFKLAVREGRITKDGNISPFIVNPDDEKKNKVSSRLPMKDLMNWARENYSRRKDFVATKGRSVGDYALSRLSSELGGSNRGVFVMDVWKNWDSSPNLNQDN